MNIAQKVGSKSKELLTAGLVTTAALAWRDVLTIIIEKYYPQKKDSFKAKTIYAMAMTILVVIVSIIMK